MDPATQSWLLIIAAIGAQFAILIAAIFAGLAAWDARRISIDTKAETQEQTRKLDTVAKETGIVLGHVNSEKTAAEKTIEFAHRENQLLRDQLKEQARVAGLLAQAASHKVASGGDRPPTGRAADVAVLEKIETNTADTASHTANAEAALLALKDQAKE